MILDTSPLVAILGKERIPNFISRPSAVPRVVSSLFLGGKPVSGLGVREGRSSARPDVNTMSGCLQKPTVSKSKERGGAIWEVTLGIVPASNTKTEGRKLTLGLLPLSLRILCLGRLHR